MMPILVKGNDIRSGSKAKACHGWFQLVPASSRQNRRQRIKNHPEFFQIITRTIYFNFGFKLLPLTVKISHTTGILFPFMSILQSVAMATNNRKDNHFLLFSTYLLHFLELASVKYLETQQSYENDSGQ